MSKNAQIEKYQKLIEKNPTKPQAYFLLAGALESEARYNEAIEAMSNAINIDLENKIYIAKRAKLYGLANIPGKSLEDITKLLKLKSESGVSDNAFDGMLLDSILEDVSKLDSVKSKVLELRKDPNVNTELLNAIDDLSSITGYLCVRVEHIDKNVAEHSDAIAELQQAQKDSMALIQKLQMASKAELAEMRTEIQAQRIKVLYAEEMCKALNERVSLLEEFKAKFPEDFVKFKAKEQEFESLLQTKTEIERKALQDYKDGFINECSVVYTTALIVKGGKVQLDIGSSYIDIASSVFSIIPYIGDTLSSIADMAQCVYTQIEMTRLEAQCDNILKYAPSVTEFEQRVNYLVISNLTDETKQKQVFSEAEELSTGWWQKIEEFTQKMKDKIQDNKANKIITAQYKFGVQDACIILEKFLLSGEAISGDSIGSSIDDLSYNIVATLKLDETRSPQVNIPSKEIDKTTLETTGRRQEAKTENPSSKSKSTDKKKCIVSYVQIKYDNPAAEMLMNGSGVEFIKQLGISSDLFLELGEAYNNNHDENQGDFVGFLGNLV